MAIDENDPRLKDMLRDIEAGDIPEDLPDPEEYDDMGGIKSLDMGAPNNKTAGMGKVMKMFSGPYGFDRNGFEDNYMNFMDYKDGGGDMGIVEFTLNAFDMVKGKEKAPSIKMASESSEEERQLELGTVYEEFLDAVKEGFQGSFDDYARQYFTRKKAMQDRQMAMNGGRMQYGDGTPDRRGNPAVMTEIENMRENRIMNPNVEDVADYKTKYLKLKAQDEEIKRMLNKAKKDKVKRAKGGIAGVL